MMSRGYVICCCDSVKQLGDDGAPPMAFIPPFQSRDEIFFKGGGL
jgi:hypothetical protein